jgi:hypothetical protein
MINDLDEALRQLLIREIPIKNGEVDVTFDQPKREWSARINRPTINLFLHDLRENNRLRQTQNVWQTMRQDDDTIVQVRRPVRVDLHYLVTAWANEPEDEHRLLTRTLMALFRQPNIPDELLPEALHNQPVPIPMMVALDEELRTPADIWGALDNEIRPVVTLIVTLAMNPYLPVTGPLVRSRELRFGQLDTTAWREQLLATVPPDTYWSVGGTVHTDRPIEDLTVTLVEQDLTVTLSPEKRFVLSRLRTGDYTLSIVIKGLKTPRQHTITVPAADYDIQL